MPRKKILPQEEPEEEFEWDKPRIIGFFAILFLLIISGIFAKHFFLDAQNIPTAQQSVQGISIQGSEESSQLPTVQSLQQGVEEQLNHLEKQASQLSVKDIASSSPQVKQVLQQLQQLPNLPSNIAKQTCENICNSL